MVIVLTHILTSILLTALLLTVYLVINQRILKEQDKNIEFECGFDSSEVTRLPFSLRFFLLIVLFLVFDIEIVLLLPLIFLIKFAWQFERIMAGGTFIAILIIGLIHEWNQGTLRWVVYIGNLDCKS